MKKLLLVLCILSCASVVSVHAQIQRTTNLGDITLRYCNDTTITGGTKTALLHTKPETPVDICMYISNSGPTDATIGLNFVDGTITADVDQKKACEPETTKTNFGQYISDYPNVIEISAGETVKIGAKALFPAGYAGMAYGCTTYQILNESGSITNTQSEQMFTILTRRASFIDINVSGNYIIDLKAQDAMMEGSLEGMSSSQISIVDSLLIPWHNIEQVIAETNPFIFSVGKPLLLRSVLTNSGNIGLELSIVSQYRSWFNTIAFNQGPQIQKLVPKQTKAIEFELPSLAWWLGGPVSVTQTITYKPIVIGSGSSLDPSLMKPQTMTLTTNGFIIARRGWLIICGSLFVVIGLLGLLLGRRSHRHKKSF